MNPNMTPIDWAKRPVLEKYADFSGRASRPEFWWFVLAVIVASIVARIVDNILGMALVGSYGPLSLIVSLGLLVPNIAVTVRRLHDSDRSGWWIGLPIAAFCLTFLFGGAALVGSAAGGAAGAVAGAGLTMLFGLVALVADVLLLVFCALPGTPGENRYGPNPHGEGVALAAE